MLKTRRIRCLVFVVADLDRTEVFYREVLGFAVRRVTGTDGRRGGLTAPTLGGVDLVFVHGEPRPGNAPIVIFDVGEGPLGDGDGRSPVRSPAEEPYEHSDVDPSGHRISTPRLPHAVHVGRRTAQLVSAGYIEAEVRWLLRLRDAPLGDHTGSLVQPARVAEDVPWILASPLRHVRRHLRTAVTHVPTAHLGSHDPDGYLFLIRPSHAAHRRQLQSRH